MSARKHPSAASPATGTAHPALTRPVMIALLLAAVTTALYWPVRHHEFINYDDEAYVTENLRVQAGLTRAGIVWAFTRLHGDHTYWHPLTWLSHMLDCQLFGLNAGPHHLVNVVFHVANVLLLFGVLRRLTRRLWPGAFVAALFALHPLQVDTVAWVAERKNVLSTLFFLLTLWAYARHVTRDKGPGARTQAPPSSPLSRVTCHRSRVPGPRSPFYWFSLLFFALGLMSKPMLVTLPFVLLLLDYWPLGRFPSSAFGLQLSTLRRLLWEKLPFLVLAAAASAVTILAHQRLGSLTSVTQMPLTARLANALVSYARYLKKIFWPQDLAVFYPHPAAWPMEAVGLAAVIVLGLSVGVFWWWRRQPYLAVGGCWFLGTLVPTIGLIQAGDQSMADRFVYVPLIGLGLALAWGVGAAAARWQWPKAWVGVVAILLLTACAVRTRDQLQHWQDSESLFTHALAVTAGNYVAYNSLGNLRFHQGRLEEAITCFQNALELHPGYALAYHNLGLSLGQKGQWAEAAACFQKALQLNPGYAQAHNELGNVRLHQNQLDEAVAHFRTALALRPRYAEAHNNLGAALAHGQRAEAMAHFQKALALQPYLADAHRNLGLALLESGRVDEAIHHFQSALAIRPDYAQARDCLAIALRQKGQGPEAGPPARAPPTP